MAQYDIIQIDDEPIDIRDMSVTAGAAGLSYLSGSSLYDLGQILRQNDAGVWVIDGVFPRRTGERAQKSGDLAVREILKVRQGARIILYSTDPGEFIDLLDSDVRLESKDKIWPAQLVEEIGKMLGRV